MADQVLPKDRLQPALLDRLTDDDPGTRVESLEHRVMSRSRLRQAVLRDLSWLLNSTQLSNVELAHAPYVRRSVVNFGLPPLSGSLASSLDIAELERAVRQAILDFEPRLLADTLEVQALVEVSELDHHNVIGLEIRSQLWSQPTPIDLRIHTEIDLETGKVRVADVATARTA